MLALRVLIRESVGPSATHSSGSGGIALKWCGLAGVSPGFFLMVGLFAPSGACAAQVSQAQAVSYSLEAASEIVDVSAAASGNQSLVLEVGWGWGVSAPGLAGDFELDGASAIAAPFLSVANFQTLGQSTASLAAILKLDQFTSIRNFRAFVTRFSLPPSRPASARRDGRAGWSASASRRWRARRA